MLRPSILTADGKLSKNVKYLIKDLSDRIVGVVLVIPDEKIIIEFLDRFSPIIVYDKTARQLQLDAEIFSGDPKVVLNRIR
jgi:soluble P-type ATPase